MALLDDLMTGSDTSFLDELTGDGSYVKKVDVNRILKDYFSSDKDAERSFVKSFHPSEMSSKDCDMYCLLSHDNPGKKESFNSRQMLIFENGHSMHSRWQKIFGGYLSGTWKCNACSYIINENQLYLDFLQEQGLHYETLTGNKMYSCSYSPESKPTCCPSCGGVSFEYVEWRAVSSDLEIAGRTDGVVDYDGERYLLEIKSANSASFETLGSSNLLMKYIKQVGLYMYVTGVVNAMILVENKNTQEYKVFYYRLENLMAQDYFHKYIERVKLLRSKLTSYRKGLISYPKLHDECVKCKFKGWLCKPN